MELFLISIGVILIVLGIWTIISFYLPTRLIRSLIRGITDIKSGKVHKESDIFKQFRADARWDKTHPIRASIIHVWYRTRAFFFNIPDIPRDVFNEVKYAYQRINRGWSNRDCWSTGGHISRLTYEMLKHHKKVAHGYPEILPKPSYVVLGMNTDAEEIYHKNCLKAWKDALDKMIYAYKLNTQLAEGERESYYPPEKLKKISKELKKMCKYLTKEEEMARQEGMILFNKYLLYIWD